jgi:hypothetical protein
MIILAHAAAIFILVVRVWLVVTYVCGYTAARGPLAFRIIIAVDNARHDPTRVEKEEPPMSSRISGEMVSREGI